jgi:hypothetical protein
MVNADAIAVSIGTDESHFKIGGCGFTDGFGSRRHHLIGCREKTFDDEKRTSSVNKRQAGQDEFGWRR